VIHVGVHCSVFYYRFLPYENVDFLISYKLFYFVFIMEVWLVVRIFFSILTSLLGFAGFVCFIYFKNYPSSVLGIITGITNVLLSHLHLLKIKKTLNQWYSNPELRQIARLGFVILCIGGACLAYFVTVQIMLKNALVPVSNSSIISIIWSFITFKSGMVLLYYAYKYYEDTDNDALLTEDESQEGVPDEEIMAENHVTKDGTQKAVEIIINNHVSKDQKDDSLLTEDKSQEGVPDEEIMAENHVTKDGTEKAAEIIVNNHVSKDQKDDAEEVIANSYLKDQIEPDHVVKDQLESDRVVKDKLEPDHVVTDQPEDV